MREFSPYWWSTMNVSSSVYMVPSFSSHRGYQESWKQLKQLFSELPSCIFFFFFATSQGSWLRVLQSAKIATFHISGTFAIRNYSLTDFFQSLLIPWKEGKFLFLYWSSFSLFSYYISRLNRKSVHLHILMPMFQLFPKISLFTQPLSACLLLGMS